MSMIDVSNLTFGYEGSPELIFDHVGFQIDSGWKLGFTGRNGRGKTTFLRLLQGEYPYSGTISASVEFEYFPYEVANLSRTGLEVVREIAPEAEDWEIQRELGLLDLAERSLELPFSSLSNGERTKVLLAAMFLKENAFLLIDEPTNHLDLEGRRKLGSYLARKRGFLLVSHDRAFLDQCVDHILAINRTNIEIQRGNFSSWWGEPPEAGTPLNWPGRRNCRRTSAADGSPPAVPPAGRTGRRRASSAWTRPGPRQRTGALWATRRPS